MEENSKQLAVKILGVALAGLIISLVILSAVPPVSRDALTHHLFVPKLYLKHGGIFEIPSIEFSYYPMLLDMLYLVPLYFGNDILPKFIHFLFGLMTAALILGYLKRRLHPQYALLGALFFLSLPVIVKLSITVYVDLGLIFFSTAALINLLKWIENGFKFKYLIISGAFCGLAISVKYNGLIICFLLALFISFLYSRLSSLKTGGQIDANRETLDQVKGIGYGAIFICVAVLVFSPWMIKNFLWTNNPIYPLYNGFFNPYLSKPPEIVSRTGEENAADKEALTASDDGATTPKRPLGHFTIRKLVYGESWWQTFSIPFRIFFQGRDDDPKYFDGRLHPLLLILPLFAFFNVRRNPDLLQIEKKILLTFSILYLLIVFFQIDMRVRWISPIIPPLVILSIMGVQEISSIIHRFFPPASGRLWKNAFLAVIFALIAVPNVIYISGLFSSIDPLSFLSGGSSRDEYIEKHRPEYAAIKYANQRLPETAKILGIMMGNRGYYFDREILFTESLFWNNLEKAGSPEKFHLNLIKSGITHLFIRSDLFEIWVNDNLGEKKKELLHHFFRNQSALMFAKNGFVLLEL